MREETPPVMRLAINHATQYRFSSPVTHGLQRLRLTPPDLPEQSVTQWALDLEGARHEVAYDDEHGNRVTLVSLLPGVETVTVRSAGTVDTTDRSGILGRHCGYLPLWHYRQPTALTRPGPRLAAMLSGFQAGDDALGTLHALCALVHATIAYVPGATDAGTGAEAALAAGRGVCQDHAHVFVAAARQLGIPARYVSGYLLMDDRTDQQAGHAWAEAHVEGLGWVGFDVANAICPDARYVRLASGRDYREAAPVTGLSVGARDESMQVAVAVGQQQAQ